MLPCRRQSPGWQLRSDTDLCGKWHRACSLPFQSPSCQECCGLQVTAQEERLGCEWMHEHGFWLKYLISVEVTLCHQWISAFLILGESWESHSNNIFRKHQYIQIAPADAGAQAVVNHHPGNLGECRRRRAGFWVSPCLLFIHHVIWSWLFACSFGLTVPWFQRQFSPWHKAEEQCRVPVKQQCSPTAVRMQGLDAE